MKHTHSQRLNCTPISVVAYSLGCVYRYASVIRLPSLEMRNIPQGGYYIALILMICVIYTAQTVADGHLGQVQTGAYIMPSEGRRVS